MTREPAERTGDSNGTRFPPIRPEDLDDDPNNTDASASLVFPPPPRHPKLRRAIRRWLQYGSYAVILMQGGLEASKWLYPPTSSVVPSWILDLPFALVAIVYLILFNLYWRSVSHKHPTGQMEAECILCGEKCSADYDSGYHHCAKCGAWVVARPGLVWEKKGP